MKDVLILYPIFPMFALTAYVLYRTFTMRVAAVKSGEISHKYYRLYNEGEEPAACRANSRHLTNLLEIPPLFYITCILIYVTDINSLLLLVCAWVFVIARFLHAYIHLGKNRLRHRYRIYILALAALAAMWIVSMVEIIQL